MVRYSCGVDRGSPSVARNTCPGAAGCQRHRSIKSGGTAGDPWATVLPASYGTGTAGKIIGDNLNATVSSRLAAASYTAPNNLAIEEIVADTSELQQSWADGGRLDVLLDMSGEHDVQLARELSRAGHGRLARMRTHRDVAPALSRLFTE